MFGTNANSRSSSVNSSNGGGIVETIVGTINRITVNSTDPANPIIDIDSAFDALFARLTLANTFTANGAVSAPVVLYNGTIFSGGSSTTTKPFALYEPSGTPSTNWDTDGTIIGINTPTGFVGNQMDFQRNGSSLLEFKASAGAYSIDGTKNDTFLTIIARRVIINDNGSTVQFPSVYNCFNGIVNLSSGAAITLRDLGGVPNGTITMDNTPSNGVFSWLGTMKLGNQFWLGNTAVTGLSAGALAATTNASVVIYDSTGQAYRVPCII